MTITYDDFNFPEEALTDIRRQLYHSSGPGYVVFPGYINQTYVEHMRKVWTQVEPYYLHEPFAGWDQVTVGSPNYEAFQNPSLHFFANFFWNQPLDEATAAVSQHIAILRNRVQGKNPLFELYAYDECAVSYRVVHSGTSFAPVPLHRDWNAEVKRGHRELWRLQATLFLSRKDEDYSGDGFIFMTNDNRRVIFGSDVQIDPGDLVIWKYTNQHGVLNVKTAPDQFGFLRIIYPPEKIRDLIAEKRELRRKYEAQKNSLKKSESQDSTENLCEASPSTAPEGDSAPLAQPNSPMETTEIRSLPLLVRLRQSIRDTTLGRRLLVPMYRQMRGLK